MKVRYISYDKDIYVNWRELFYLLEELYKPEYAKYNSWNLALLISEKSVWEKVNPQQIVNAFTNTQFDKIREMINGEIRDSRENISSPTPQNHQK